MEILSQIQSTVMRLNVSLDAPLKDQEIETGM